MSKKIIAESNIFNNRNKLVDFYNEYNKVDSLKKSFLRMKNNERKSFFYWFIAFVVIDILVYLIGLAFILTSTYVVISVWILLIIITVLVIIKNSDNFEEYRKTVNKLRYIELCELLKKYGIYSNNIDDVIKYFTLEIEPENKIYEKPTFLKPVLGFGSNIFYLILGAIIPKIISEKVKNDRVQTYALIFAVLIIVAITMVVIKVYIYFNNKNKYFDTVNKLILELKMIKILNDI